MNEPTSVHARTFWRIRNWSTIYENNRSREIKDLHFVLVPNRMDTDGYTTLLDHPNGAAHLGAWVALLQIASRCKSRGDLRNSDGIPHSSRTLSRISRIPASVFDELFPRLLEVLWIEQVVEMSQEGAGMSQEGAAPTRAGDSVLFCSSEAFIKSEKEESAERNQTAVAIRESDGWQEYIGVFLAAGKPLNDRDLEKALREWLSMDAGNRAQAQLSAVQVCGAADSQNFIPLPVNHLVGRAWTRRAPERVLPVTKPPSKAQRGQDEAERRFDEMMAKREVNDAK